MAVITISELEESFYDDQVPETSLGFGKPGTSRNSPIEIAYYLHRNIQGIALYEQFFQVHESRSLRKCLAWRLLHITLGYYQMTEERGQSF